MPPAAPPTCSTTTASGPRPIPSSTSAWTSSSVDGERWMRSSSEFRTVYWPGCVDSRTPCARASAPTSASRSAHSLRLVAELRQLGVRRVRRQAGRHAVHRDAVVVEVPRGSPRGGRGRRGGAGSDCQRRVSCEGQPARPGAVHGDAEAGAADARGGGGGPRPRLHPRPAGRGSPGPPARPPPAAAGPWGGPRRGARLRRPGRGHRARERREGGRRPGRLPRRAGARAAARRADGRRRRPLPARAGGRGRRLRGAGAVGFARLARELARRSGVGGRPLGPAGARAGGRRRGAARTPLEALAASAATPGFARRRSCGWPTSWPSTASTPRGSPARCAPGRRRSRRAAGYAGELGALNGALRDALDAARAAATPVLRAFAALDALRLDPWRWGGAPVFLYGFDDLTALQLDAVATLARHAGAEVTVSLTYEPGRVAFAGRGATFQELLALADRHVALEARAEHYAPVARGAAPPRARAVRARAAAAGRARARCELLEGGGERAELELVAARGRALLRDGGLAPEDVAVVLREPEPTRPLLARSSRPAA